MQERYIATVDLGSSKIALCVAKVTGDDTQIIYFRETPSDGIRYSCVFNPKRAAMALRKAISLAEDELKIKILQVVVGLPRYEVRQEVASATINRTDPESCISDEEISNLKDMALDSYPLDDESKEVIYGAVAQSFAVEGLLGSEADIVGTTSDTLEGNFKIFVGAKKSLANIDIMMNDLKIAAARKYFLPHSVAEAVLSKDERDNGVALIEIGAGVTSVTIYEGNLLRHYSSIPFGGKSITNDIKYECAFNESLAENIKLAFGACMPDKLQSLSEKILQINDDESGTYEQLPVKYLSEIITCRAKEIVNAILYQIQESHYADRLRSGVVITGGGAYLANLGNLIKEMSGYNVRLGFPRTRSLSAEGCDGINEAGAVASVAMILSAAKDEHLNCIDEIPVPEPEPVEETAAEEAAPVEEVKDYTGSIFDPLANIEKPKPAPKPKTQKSSSMLKGFGIPIWKKMKDAAKIGFEGTLGNLYDDIETNEE